MSLGKGKRYAQVAGAALRVGAGVAASKLRGGEEAGPRQAALFRAALGGLKGPLMKVGQLLAAIPDFLPRDMAAELATLQTQAPPMGWPFVRRRMAGELGPDWQKRFASFEKEASAAASLGQVHRAVSPDGEALACKLQYPDMDAAVEADLRQLKLAFALFERFDGTVATQAAYDEIATRLREELDYAREARNIALYETMLAGEPGAQVPSVLPALSTPRLLTMRWLEGEPFLQAAQTRGQADRNHIATHLFRAWYAPFYGYGVIHGDPHPGNYTVREDGAINLLDFGCIRLFEPRIVEAVVTLYKALAAEDEAMAAHAYRLWGFADLSRETMAVLNIWARFVYAPLMEDRARPIEETNATAYGRETAAKVHRALRESGAVKVPPEFVMIDRASVGLGGAFLRLKACVNWHRLFHDLTDSFDPQKLAAQQKQALTQAKLAF